MEPLLLYDHRASICSQMARLALVEKELVFSRRQIDIMGTNEQFEPWYIALNPRAVVPTLALGDRVVTDTITIVNAVQDMAGPDLSGDATTQGWLRDIMALHYGVLLYRKRLDPDGTAPQIMARGDFLRALQKSRPDLADVTTARLAGNTRFQKLLQDPEGVEDHLAATRALVDRMIAAAAIQPFIAGQTYSLADCFATAALARFSLHGFASWWADTALQDYYARMHDRRSFAVAEVIDTESERDL